MNAMLHGIEGKIIQADALSSEGKSFRDYDVVLTNPPFGTKGANQAPDRDDFTIETSNKQLNFVQHVLTILKPGGRAAVVLPDNCLFADQAGEVFKLLTEDCDLHTVLRLPRGTFTPYSQGVKANVIFFQKGLPTETTWIFDARSNVPGITKKDRPLTAQHFEEFEAAYGADPNGQSKDHPQKAKNYRLTFNSAEIRNFAYSIQYHVNGQPTRCAVLLGGVCAERGLAVRRFTASLPNCARRRTRQRRSTPWDGDDDQPACAAISGLQATRPMPTARRRSAAVAVQLARACRSRWAAAWPRR